MQLIACHETVHFELNSALSNKHSYIVFDAITCDLYTFGFSEHDDVQERAAYEHAARIYNTLVPENECIPLS